MASLFSIRVDELSRIPIPVIALIGKRDVPDNEVQTLIEMGRKLAEKLPNAMFRSGNADGADTLFVEGVRSVDPNRLALFLPRQGHRKNTADGLTTYALETLNLASEPSIVAAARTHPGTRHNVDNYLRGDRDRFSVKVPYILRDAWMILGSTTVPLPRVDAVIYYDDIKQPLSGGTGFTVKLARSKFVNTFNQDAWKPWFETT
jgi:hypothetical protein